MISPYILQFTALKATCSASKYFEGQFASRCLNKHESLYPGSSTGTVRDNTTSYCRQNKERKLFTKSGNERIKSDGSARECILIYKGGIGLWLSVVS